jgi:hypothetical protein
MLEEAYPNSDPPKFTIENGYMFYLDDFCVGKFSNGDLGLHLIGEFVYNRPRDMTNCMPITVERAPSAFDMLIKLETEEPICPQEEIDAGSHVNNLNSPRYYLKGGVSDAGRNSCRDHRLPRGLTFLTPFSETIDSGTISGSVLTMQSTKER